MKRNRDGIPVGMVQRWTRPPSSCKSCRIAKRRCDRLQPCSNCALRSIGCAYGVEEPEATSGDASPQTHKLRVPAVLNVEEMMGRIRKLEDAVFKYPDETTATIITSPSKSAADGSTIVNAFSLGRDDVNDSNHTSANDSIDTIVTTSRWTPMELHVPSILRDRKLPLDLTIMSKNLPPQDQAMDLLDHFIVCVQPTFGVLHIPSTQALVEQAYQDMAEGGEPSHTTLLLLFSIFAGAALTWNDNLLRKVGATPAIAQEAFATYSDLAMSLAEHASPSTAVLEAMTILIHILTNGDGFGEKVHQLRNRAFLMARIMQIHRLDTAQSRKERKLKGCNMVEVEVQRRIWWHMASSDWLVAFSGGAQEGTYIFHPRHMNVSYPSNVDDELMTSSEEVLDLPTSTATSMSYFRYRILMAELCREVVDTLPSLLLEPQELDYSIVLSLDVKFEAFIKALPTFFQLDIENVQNSQEIHTEKPYLLWQRTTLNFSIATYRIRLHQPFHLESMSDAKYIFSRKTCVSSAHDVLLLQRSMDTSGVYAGLKAPRFWIVAQHVFLAAITLAAEVSFDPNHPLAEFRKSEVLAACNMLEQLRHESKVARDRIEKGVQALLTTLHKQTPPNSVSRASALAHSASSPDDRDTGSATQLSQEPADLTGTQDRGEAPLGLNGDVASSRGQIGETGENWDLLWAEFFSAAPEWDVPQWNSLLEDINWNIGPAL